MSDDVLNKLERADIAQAEQLSLSLNAISTTESTDIVRIRALIDHHVMLILLDSGSSHSFINASFADRISTSPQSIKPVPVKVANGQILICDKWMPQLNWWAQGNTFQADMHVIELGAYDAILGMDWLRCHSPMLCNWDHRKVSFPHDGKQVTLQGVQTPSQLTITETPIEQLANWNKGNEVWALAVMQPAEDSIPTPVPP